MGKSTKPTILLALLGLLLFCTRSKKQFAAEIGKGFAGELNPIRQFSEGK